MFSKLRRITALWTSAGLLISAGVAHSNSPQRNVWISPDEAVVYFIPMPELRIELRHMGIDYDHWDQLNIELIYTSESLEKDYQDAKAAHPGFDIRRLDVHKASEFTLAIPAVALSQPLITRPGEAGPYFRYTLFLNKAESHKLRAAYATSGSLVALSGQIAFQPPIQQVLERVEIDESICDLLIPDGDATVYSVVKRLPNVLKRVNNIKTRYPSTKVALQNSVMEKCIDLQTDGPIQSFKDLLTLKVSRKHSGRPFGETRPHSYTGERQVADVIFRPINIVDGERQ